MAYSPRRREYLPGEENRYNTNGDLQERRHTAGGTLDARGDSHRTEALVGPTREGRYGHPRSMQCAGGKRCPNFHNPGVQVIKEVCISYEKGLSWLSEWYHVLASFHSRFFPGTSTLHLYPYCDDGTTGHYHLIAHSSKTLCWLCQQTNFDSGPLGIHDERQLQYWSHAEYMPKNETYLGLEQAKGFITCGIPDSGGIGLEGPPTSTFTQELESLRSRADQPTKSDHTLRLDRLSSHAGTSGTTNARPLTRRPSSTSSIKARSRRSKVCRKYDNRLDDTAIAKGLHRSLYGSSRISRFEACSEDSAVCPECVDCAEALGHVGLSPTAPITWPEINQSVHRHSSPAAIPGTTVHENSKRALVIGINYDSSRLEGAGRLLFAVNDAERVARSLSRHGFPDDNAVILTDRDGERQNRATHRAIMEQISRLVVNAKPGDTLFFFFSGHGCHNHPLHGTGLITADDQIISQRQLENALVAQVPAGCELHVFIDSCRASSMIQLPHCVERMHFKPDRPSSAVPVIPYVFFLASNLPFCPPTPPMPATHGSSARFTFPSPCFELAGMELAPGTTNGRDRDQGTLIESGQVQDACHEEPKTVGSVKTTGGMVFFWPSTGDYYNAFESYNAPGVRNGVEVRNGIMANALCDALDNRVDKQPSIRAVWESLVKNIEEENRWRQERDSKKSPTQQAKLTPGSRVQLAELWISQYGSLSTIASVLDLPLFSN